MQVTALSLVDFRNYARAEVELGPGLTVVRGPNGHGKTNLLEAVGWLSTMASFRGVGADALVRAGAERAVLRAEAVRDGRELLLEAELGRGGRPRVQVNRQRLARSRDLLGALRTSVFAPDDLVLVKGGPAERRGFLDEVVVAERPARDALRTEVERVLRQRNALLRQAGGRLGDDVALTLDVWDAKLAAAGEALVAERRGALERLVPHLRAAYAQVAEPSGRSGEVGVAYEAAWETTGLAAALAASRADDVRRGVSTVGPHRDDLYLAIGGLPARTHASQGEQRSLALALRLGAHLLVAEAAGSAPVLLLDDVFSELDPHRSDALLRALPPGQVLLSTAGALPEGADPQQTLVVEHGHVQVAS